MKYATVRGFGMVCVCIYIITYFQHYCIFLQSHLNCGSMVNQPSSGKDSSVEHDDSAVSYGELVEHTRNSFSGNPTVIIPQDVHDPEHDLTFKDGGPNTKQEIGHLLYGPAIASDSGINLKPNPVGGHDLDNPNLLTLLRGSAAVDAEGTDDGVGIEPAKSESVDRRQFDAAADEVARQANAREAILGIAAELQKEGK